MSTFILYLYPSAIRMHCIIPLIKSLFAWRFSRIDSQLIISSLPPSYLFIQVMGDKELRLYANCRISSQCACIYFANRKKASGFGNESILLEMSFLYIDNVVGVVVFFLLFLASAFVAATVFDSKSKCEAKASEEKQSGNCSAKYP